jgi:hypothetical protein
MPGPSSTNIAFIISRSHQRAPKANLISVGSRSAVSIPGEENFILAKNLPMDGTNSEENHR